LIYFLNNNMESDLRDRLADINDELKEIIPQLE
jgi:hypothetical protein